MKVKDLIEKLQEFDPEGDVLVRDYRGYWSVGAWQDLVNVTEEEIEDGWTEVFLE